MQPAAYPSINIITSSIANVRIPATAMAAAIVTGKIFFLDWDKSQNTKNKMMTSIDSFNRIRQITGGIVLFLAIHNFMHRLI
jgi:hypothetical protein